MVHIVVDLEMNAIPARCQKERQYAKMEIIQIGAVALNDKYEEIDSYSTYVKPQYDDKVEEFYTHLTGITTKMISDAPDFKTAIDDFFLWIEHFEGEIEVVSWSMSDRQQIFQEARLKEYSFDTFESYVLDQWTDLQLEFDRLEFMNHRTSLADACSAAGLSMEGKLHNGLDDARNTAHLLHILRDDDLYEKTFGKVYSYQEKSRPTTIGDVIDFSQFHFDEDKKRGCNE